MLNTAHRIISTGCIHIERTGQYFHFASPLSFLMLFFARSLAALRRSSLYGAVSLKQNLPLRISKVRQPFSSSSISLHSPGYCPAYLVSLFLRSVLYVQTSMIGFASSKYMLVVFLGYTRELSSIVPCARFHPISSK